MDSKTGNARASSASERLKICRDCERLFKPTQTCRECGCFMVVKTRLINARCPLGKW